MLIPEMDSGGGTLLSYRAIQAVDRILGGDACILLRHRELAFRNYNLSGDDGGYVFCRPVFPDHLPRHRSAVSPLNLFQRRSRD